jgi:hypothetical protein
VKIEVAGRIVQNSYFCSRKYPFDEAKGKLDYFGKAITILNTGVCDFLR